MRPGIRSLLASGCLLVAAGASQAAPIGWGAAPVLRVSFPASLAVARARLAQPAPGVREIALLSASAPLSLPRPGRGRLLTVRPGAIFASRALVTDFAAQALDPQDLGPLDAGDPIQPKPPRETRTRLPRRHVAVSRPTIAYRGDLAALLPFGAGLLGIGVLGGRRSGSTS